MGAELMNIRDDDVSKQVQRMGSADLEGSLSLQVTRLLSLKFAPARMQTSRR